MTVKIRNGVWGLSNVRYAFVKLSFLLEIMLWCLLQVETVLCRPAVWLLAGCILQRWRCDVWCLVGLQDVLYRDGGAMFGWLAGCILQRWWCNVTMCDVWLVCRMYFTEMALWCLVGLQDVFYRDGVVMFGWFAGCLLQRWCCDVWCLVGFQDVFCGDSAGIGVPAQLRHCASRPQTWQVSHCLSLSLTVSPLSLLSLLTPFTATLMHKSWYTS